MSGNQEHGRISELALEKVRNRSGKEYPIEHPYIRAVSPDAIRHVCLAVGDTNPLYLDADYARETRWEGLIAPPAIFYGVGWGSWDMRRGEGLPGVHGLHAGDHWWFYRPPMAGDTIDAVKKQVSIEPMEGRLAGKKMMMQVREVNYHNSEGARLARQQMNVVRMERSESKSKGKYAQLEEGSYTKEEIEQIDAELAQEEPRGSQTRWWEDVRIGDPLSPVVKGPLTVADVIAWVQGVGSPHIRTGKYWLEYRQQSPQIAVRDPVTNIPETVERVHWDNYMAAEIGMPAAYDYGAQRGGYATYFLTNWMSDEGWLAELDFELRGMFFLGDVMRIRGRVEDKWRGTSSGNAYVDIEFESVTQRGDDIMPGRAVVALPSKDTGAVRFPVLADEDRNHSQIAARTN